MSLINTFLLAMACFSCVASGNGFAATLIVLVGLIQLGKAIRS